MCETFALAYSLLTKSIFAPRAQETANAACLSTTLQTLFIHPASELGVSMYFLGIVRH